MDKLSKISLFLLLSFLISCSTFKTLTGGDEPQEEDSLEETVQNDLEDVSMEEDGEGQTEAEAVEVEEGTEDQVVNNESEQSSVEDTQAAAEAVAADSPETEMSEEVGEYTVGENETLMLIGFKLYGDYRKWKELKSFNNLTNVDVGPGTVLKYRKPEQEFSWQPKGLPHLIKRGESLVSISRDKYQTPNKWNLIYENNRPMIRYPELIFAGFTIYYIPLRDLASQ